MDVANFKGFLNQAQSTHPSPENAGLPGIGLEESSVEILHRLVVEPGEQERLDKIDPPLAHLALPDERLRLAQTPRRLRLGQAGLFAGLAEAPEKLLISGVVRFHGDLIDRG